MSATDDQKLQVFPADTRDVYEKKPDETMEDIEFLRDIDYDNQVDCMD